MVLQKQQPRLDLKRLVFIDEISVSTTITRVYGRAAHPKSAARELENHHFRRSVAS
jgi:hypothetical protein